MLQVWTLLFNFTSTFRLFGKPTCGLKFKISDKPHVACALISNFALISKPGATLLMFSTFSVLNDINTVFASLEF